jgi:hypothetical protein
MNASPVPEVDVHELARKIRSGESFVLLDVREARELDCALIQDTHEPTGAGGRNGFAGRNGG